MGEDLSQISFALFKISADCSDLIFLCHVGLPADREGKLVDKFSPIALLTPIHDGAELREVLVLNARL